MKKLWIPIVALLAVMVLPDVAHACPVCFDPREENRFAFLATTAFLSLLPLSLIGLGVSMLKKRSRELDEEERLERDRDERPF